MKKMTNVSVHSILLTVVLLSVLIMVAACATAPAGPLEITIEDEGPSVLYYPSRPYSGDYHITWSLEPEPEIPPRSQDFAVIRAASEDMQYELVGFEGPGFYFVRVAAEVDGDMVYSDQVQLYLAGGTP